MLRPIKGFAAKVRSDSGWDGELTRVETKICSPIFTGQDNRHLICIPCTVGLVPAHLRPGGVAVLDEGLNADLDLGLDGRLGILDETTLLVILVALLLLLRRVGRCV